MTVISEKSRRLFLSDTGFLGMACVEAQIDGPIWMLGGITCPKILRELEEHGKIRYTVVGKAYVHLSWPDHVRTYEIIAEANAEGSRSRPPAVVILELI